MSKVHVITHPLVQHKMSFIRDKNTGTKEFRELTEEITYLVAYEMTADLGLEDVEVETPVCPATVQRLAGKKVGIIPILRAGLGMVEGMLKLIPTAKVGHIGLYRDEETLEPVEYYCKLPSELGERTLIVTDPMLATGGSAVAAIQFLKDQGGKNIKFMCMIAAPEGIAKLQAAHPDVNIYTAAIDERLNEKGYIVPGLGDAGDRLYGTL